MEIKALKSGLSKTNKLQLDRIIAEEVTMLEHKDAAKLKKVEDTLKALGRKWVMQAAAVDLGRNRFRSIEIELKLQHEAAKLRGTRYGKL